MHGHYLLKLTASLARGEKHHCILLYLCESFVHVLYLHTAMKFSPLVMDNMKYMLKIVLPGLFEEFHQPVSAQFSSISKAS